MKLEGIMLSEISQIEKDKYDLIYMQNRKKILNPWKQKADWWLSGAGKGE